MNPADAASAGHTMSSQPNAARAVARVHNLSVTFPAARQSAARLRTPGLRSAAAVSGVSLAVHAGECVALVGESGSGKSLTARALLGLVPAHARVQYEELLVVQSRAAEATNAPDQRESAWSAIRGRLAALIPQDALGSLDPLRRIEHEVGDSLRIHEIARGAQRRELVLSALSDAGVPDPASRLRQRSDQLSGGLRQRALVASALIGAPEFIVADEPTTALDSSHRGRILAELRDRANAGAGVLLITHDLLSVLDIADRVHVMRAGRIIETGTPSEVLHRPEHPFTRELLASSPAGKPRGTRLRTTTTVSVQEPVPAPVPGAAPTQQPRPCLSLTGITAGFHSAGTHTRVLSDASLEVFSGETVGLIGESGSGKTTLLRIALGLLAPSSGSVSIDGVDRATARPHTRRSLLRRIGFVPQDPLDSFPRSATGLTILADALRAGGVPRGERRARALALAEEVGVSHSDLARSPALLSGGQRQRIAIARALARQPDVLLLDEPVSALDITVQARVLDLLNDLQSAHGTAYLLVSHDLDVIEHMSDRVLQLTGGRITPLPVATPR